MWHEFTCFVHYSTLAERIRCTRKLFVAVLFYIYVPCVPIVDCSCIFFFLWIKFQLLFDEFGKYKTRAANVLEMNNYRCYNCRKILIKMIELTAAKNSTRSSVLNAALNCLGCTSEKKKNLIKCWHCKPIYKSKHLLEHLPNTSNKTCFQLYSS